MKIKSPRINERSISFHVEFKKEDGSWFSFDCDKFGTVKNLTPQAAASYAKCINGEYKVVGPYYQEHVHSNKQPAIGICDDCGDEVWLDGFTNTCNCGADYNMSGQKLADRSQWGSDTGESLSDILMIK